MNFRSITILLVALFVAVGAMAQQPKPAAVLAQYLQLTPDQAAAWKQIRSDAVTAAKPLVADLRDLRQQLAAAVKANDEAAAGKLTLQIALAREQLRAAREAANAKLEAVLTPDQKTKFEAFQAAVEFLKQRR